MKMRLPKKFIFIACVLALIEVKPLQASPWVMPDNLLIRHDIQILVDSGALNIPISTWPIAWGDIAYNLTKNESEMSLIEIASFQRIKDALIDAEMGGLSGQTDIKVAKNPNPFTWFNDTVTFTKSAGAQSTFLSKNLAINLKEGKDLLNISKKKKLYVGNAPDTFLGGGNQKSKELIDRKVLGKVSLGNAIFAFPGVQSYHPNPEPWFAKKEGGPVIDMGPYYLTALVNLLGPAKIVKASSLMKGAKFRTIGIGPKKGKKIKVECPTTYFSTIVFKNNCTIRLTLSFDVIAHQRNHIELYGTKGSMIVPDPNMFGGSVYICKKLGSSWNEYKTNNMPLGKINIRSQSSRANESPTNANYRGVGLAEMAYCIEQKKQHRCSGELAVHVLDLIQSIMQSAKKNKPKKLTTTCKLPKPFSLKEIKKILK